ncbi:MAG: BON domain-containing protein [Opitutae bacterium]|nr:BON domain-containing protein [Opitutae bacterium]
MKPFTRILSAAALAAGLAGSVVLSTGCAGTATRASTGEMIDDSVITAKVKTELIRDEVVKARDINVDTFRGTVQLSGFVETPEQKARAGDIAARVTGVHNVVNNITVKVLPPPR